MSNHPVRNWARPTTELHPDLKKEIDFLRRGDRDGDHYCIIHPDMLSRGNKEIFTHHQLEAFRQAVEDVRIELNMNARLDTSSMFTPDGRPMLIVQLVPADQDDGTLPEPHPADSEALLDRAGIIVDEHGQELPANPTDDQIRTLIQ